MSAGAPRGRRRVRAAVTGWVPTRLIVTGAVITLLFAAIGYRAYGLQVVESDRFRELAQRQHLETFEVPAPRGPIYDRLGRELAVTAEIESVFANPREVRNVAGTAARLAEILDVDLRELEGRLASGRHFVWVERHVAPEEAELVRRAELPGVALTVEPRRFYPSQSLAGPILGFAGIDGDGLDGLELAMDDLLLGERAKIPALRDATGGIMLSEAETVPRSGAAVTLTLDRSVQYIAERVLEETVTLHEARAGVILVLDVGTADILAAANWPTYDPNEPGKASRRQARNRVVTDAYEIGSVMKIFSVAAALEAGAVEPDTVIDVEKGRYRVGRNVIRDSFHDEELTVGGVLKRSSNVGAYKIAARLGEEKLHEALLRYGFGEKTGVELPGERAGLVHPPRTWGETGLAAVSYGYNMMATPLQVAAALAAVGNGGVYHEPRIVREVRSPGGELLYRRKVAGHRMMRAETARQLLPMLESVFDPGRDGGTARSLSVPGFRVGGKTGTAHKVDPHTHRYAEDKYLSSFVGLAPIDDPRIAVLVLIDEPRGEHYYGARVAGPAFTRVVSETLRYLGVPASEGTGRTESRPEEPNAPPPRPSPRRGEGRVGGDAEAVDPSPRARDLPADDPDAVRIPDFHGLGVARALDLAAERGIEVEIEGTGRAVRQKPPPGPAPRPAACRIVFAPPNR